MVVVQHLLLLRKIVALQAQDESIWFQPTCITEDYLQRQLRLIHSAILLNNIDDLKRIVENLKEQQKCG